MSLHIREKDLLKIVGKRVIRVDQEDGWPHIYFEDGDLLITATRDRAVCCEWRTNEH